MSQGNKDDANKLIKYFLASLTTPEKDLWVNLSPYEKNRIVPDSFGQTAMGRDLLAQDYLLKQLTASLIYPEGEVGKKFWAEVYKKAGNINVPINTFNKVWIVPDKAVVYENAKAGTAYVVSSSLKVMTEQDYLASSKNVIPAKAGIQDSQIVRNIVVPVLTKEVNEGANFAQLRQVYNSLILATWYKKKIKDSILNAAYADKSKISGVNIEAGDKQVIYEQYLTAFKKGAYNLIKEEQDPVTGQMVPRKYFSGGMKMTVPLQTIDDADPAMIAQLMPDLKAIGNKFWRVVCDVMAQDDVPASAMPAPRSLMDNLDSLLEQLSAKDSNHRMGTAQYIGNQGERVKPEQFTAFAEKMIANFLEPTGVNLDQPEGGILVDRAKARFATIYAFNEAMPKDGLPAHVRAYRDAMAKRLQTEAQLWRQINAEALAKDPNVIWKGTPQENSWIRDRKFGYTNDELPKGIALLENFRLTSLEDINGIGLEEPRVHYWVRNSVRRAAAAILLDDATQEVIFPRIIQMVPAKDGKGFERRTLLGATADRGMTSPLVKDNFKIVVDEGDLWKAGERPRYIRQEIQEAIGAFTDSLTVDQLMLALKGITGEEIGPDQLGGNITFAYVIQGGMKHIFKLTLDRKEGAGEPIVLALKIAKTNLGLDDMTQEARDLGLLRGAGVPKWGGAFKSNGKLWFLEEWVEGKTLHSIREGQGRLEEWMKLKAIDVILDIARQLGGKAPVDVKKDNFMLKQKDNEIIMVDIGDTRALIYGDQSEPAHRFLLLANIFLSFGALDAARNAVLFKRIDERLKEQGVAGFIASVREYLNTQEDGGLEVIVRNKALFAGLKDRTDIRHFWSVFVKNLDNYLQNDKAMAALPGLDHIRLSQMVPMARAAMQHGDSVDVVRAMAQRYGVNLKWVRKNMPVEIIASDNFFDEVRDKLKVSTDNSVRRMLEKGSPYVFEGEGSKLSLIETNGYMDTPLGIHELGHLIFLSQPELWQPFLDVLAAHLKEKPDDLPYWMDQWSVQFPPATTLLSVQDIGEAAKDFDAYLKDENKREKAVFLLTALSDEFARTLNTRLYFPLTPNPKPLKQYMALFDSMDIATPQLSLFSPRKKASLDKATITDPNTGGIDLTPEKMGLKVKEDGIIQMRMDAAMLKQWQGASGAMPVIMGIELIKDLPLFLGMQAG